MDAIGDALVTVPLLAALRRAGFAASAVLRRANAQAFAPGALQRVHVAEEETAAHIAAFDYDVALIPSEEPQAYALARGAHIPVRVGFEHGLLGKPLKSWWIRRQCTQTVRRAAGLDTRGLHEAEIVFRLGRALLKDTEPSRDPVALRPFVVDGSPVRDSRAAFQVTEKWLRLGATFDALAEAARGLAKAREVRWIAAASEAAFAARFAQATGARVETFETLAPWKFAIAAARALVAPDSGAVHVAGMTGTPVVALYAANNHRLQIARWRPWAAPFRALAIAEEWPAEVEPALASLLNERASA